MCQLRKKTLPKQSQMNKYYNLHNTHNKYIIENIDKAAKTLHKKAVVYEKDFDLSINKGYTIPYYLR